MDRRRHTGEQGFTVIEVLVALVVIVIGLLGVLTMLDTGNQTTGRTMAREQGTTLARDVIERARSVPYASLAASAAPLISAALPDSTSAASSGTWTVRRRNHTYTVHVSACRLDDPSDGVGPVDSSFCTTGTTNPGPGPGGGGAGASLTLLGIPLNVTLGGPAVATICTLLGQSPTLDKLLGQTGAMLQLIRTGASVRPCPDSSTQIAIDIDPDDLTRVSTTVSWTAFGRPETTTQATLIPNPGVAP